MSGPRYFRWGSVSGREGINRELDPTDADDVEFCRVNGLTIEEANKLGMRREVSAKDIRTGEMKPAGERTRMPFFTVRAGR